MDDDGEVLTPNSCRYSLRSRTPSTPQKTPATPINGSHNPVTNGTPTRRAGTPTRRAGTPTRRADTPTRRILCSTGTPLTTNGTAVEVTTPLKSSPLVSLHTPISNGSGRNTPSRRGTCTPTLPVNTPMTTPLQRAVLTPSTPMNTPQSLQRQVLSPSHSSIMTKEERSVFKTPMSHKPRIVGNRAVPSPSRHEIWKKELGFTESDAPSESDKENTSDEEESGNCNQAPLAEFRALQKELAVKNAQRDESLLLIKNCKEKIRKYETRLEREETSKRQQLKIIRKTHEDQQQEKTQLIDTLQAIVNEQEERIRELEEGIASTPRKRVTRRNKNAPPASTPTPTPPPQSEHISALIDDIRRLQEEKALLAIQLDEVQLELTNQKEEQSKEGLVLTNGFCDNNSSSQNQGCPCGSKVQADVERQLESLQTDRRRLQDELADARNDHNKALTVSKLGAHRQQQLEEEIKRLKSSCAQLEEEKCSRSEELGGLESARSEITTLGQENVRLQGQVRDLQAQIFSLQAKSPEVVTKVKQVESESLRQRYESIKSENVLLKHTCDARKTELHDAQNQVRYLERMLSVTETAKEKADSDLWKELEAQHTDHQAALTTLRQQLEDEKHDEINDCENRLSVEHKAELQAIVQSLNDKHQQELQESEESRVNVKQRLEKEMTKKMEEKYHLLSQFESEKEAMMNKFNEELSKFEEEKAQEFSLMEEEKVKGLSQMEAENDDLKEEIKIQLNRFEADMLKLEKKCKIEYKQLEEDLTIAKSAAVNRTREEMQREKQTSLSALEEKLTDEHRDEIDRLTSHIEEQIEEAVNHERKTTADKMSYLETRYEQLVDQLTGIQPILSQFVESYILLQKEVKRFPKMIDKTVAGISKQMLAAITGVSEYNKELVQKYQREMKLRKKYHNELVELKGNIRVFCRVRPTIKEDGGGPQSDNIVTLDQDDSGLLYINSKGRTQTFEVDRVFGESCSQPEVFDEVKALVTSCIDGYNVCIFAYGQTGSGKTYTMEGTADDPGINQRALSLLFEETAARHDWEYSINVSVLEIYNEMIRDLLGEDTGYKMEVKMNPDGGYHIPGLCFVQVESVADVNECFRLGQQNRATAATNMNEHSSRSHALLCVTLIGFNKTTAAKTTGKLNLVDLAGSERVSKSKADGARLKEAQAINKSLSSLGDVIFALRSKQNYIPYRNSKLTYLLQDSLGGDSKTLMITQIAPVRKNEAESICSLNFAQRVRNVELGAATRKLENGDGTENDPSSPARGCLTPQRGNLLGKSGTPTSALVKPGSSTPSNLGMKQQNLNTPTSSLNMKVGTPSSASKLTPSGRMTRKK
ncbi:kinesin-like protein KIFC3 isoform X2 [Mya arenaria]|uniref:kinesin-like protein KIFC3 isoform X2 n=1 Tax=Mya arenaria TaxID=6604 RepID=UPI0022E1C92F|nr:kinesin-like protein KIFC3 isoform X2 [Mya arenaria]